jgi:hypothetical protein
MIVTDIVGYRRSTPRGYVAGSVQFDVTLGCRVKLVHVPPASLLTSYYSATHCSTQ